MTLGLGLMLTLLFAATAIGTLNLVSVGFGVLFVGIAVDFALQFAVRFREARHDAGDVAEALRLTARRAGSAILVAALATAAGFLAFVPTAFSGVAELGLIAGTGMLIAFLCTMTFLPAAITLCRARDERAEVGFAWGRRADTLLTRWHRPILMGFTALVVLALALAPRLTFDSDPLDTQSPNTEAMRTLRDLMNQPLSNPYSIDILAQNRGPGAPAGGEAAATSDGLEGSHDRQLRARRSKREARAGRGRGRYPDAEPVAADRTRGRRPPAEIRTAAQSALAKIDPALHLLPKNDPLNAVAGDLSAIAHAPDSTVRAVDGALTRFLPLELDRLRTALGAAPANVSSVPEGYRAGLAPAGWAGAGGGAACGRGAQQPGSAPSSSQR